MIRKPFHQADYDRGDKRIQKCAIVAMLAFCGIWKSGEREFKRYQFLILTIPFLFLAVSAMGQEKTDTTKKDISLFRNATVAASIATMDSAQLSKLRLYGTYSTNVITMPKYYTINWKKVKTIADLKAIIEAMNVTFGDNYKGIKQIKKYLILTK